MKYDNIFKHMKEDIASIFYVNKIHAGKMNAKNNNILEMSQRKMFQSKEGQYCKIVSSSSLAPIITYNKSKINLMGITGLLVDRIRRKIEDKYGQWCGFVLLGKDNREILVLTSYNVPQETPAGDDTLISQQTSLYLLDGKVDPHPRKLFICDLLFVITTATKENQDIILMGYCNEVIGDDPKMMTPVISAGRLTDVHAHKHGNHTNIATYIQSKRQVDYCFVFPEII